MTSTERRKANEKANKKQRGGWRKLKGIWPEQDPDYLEWIRALPCVVCSLSCWAWWLATIALVTSGFRVSQAAHVGRIRGMSQKCSDRETIPLCDAHHDHGRPESHHGLGKLFWEYHGINRDAIIKVLNAAYDAIL